jgi:alanine racemase
MEKLPTWVEINLDSLIHNVEAIQRLVGNNVGILLIVKADAYGHGAVQIAQAVEQRVDCFGVATVDEAIELTAAGIRKKILIISPILAKEIPDVVDRGFIATVSSFDFAKAMSDYAAGGDKTAHVHVEADTGMGRAGFLASEVLDLVGRIATLPGLRLGGMFTHFPIAEADQEFTRGQVGEFLEVVERARQAGVEVPILHCANSSAIASVRESHMDLVRPGLLVYGHHPGAVTAGTPVKQIMTWKCRIAQVRELPSGSPISYGKTYTTSRPTTMAVLPVGYGHGYPLRLSNRGEAIVRGERVPILGRVTMDMTMVDVTDVAPRPQAGDEVVLMGTQEGTTVTVDEIADWAGTISYEILTGIGKRVPRTYLRGGRIETYKSLLGVTPTDGHA